MKKKILNLFSNYIAVENVSNSTVVIKIQKAFINVWNRKFKVTDKWFSELLAKTYDDELKSKYILELHQNNNFQNKELVDLIDFEIFVGFYNRQISVCEGCIKSFKNSFKDYHDALENESILVINPEYKPLLEAYLFCSHLSKIERQLKSITKIFKLRGYNVLSEKENLVEIIIDFHTPIGFKSHNWSVFLDKKPIDDQILRYLFQNLSQIYLEISTLNKMLNNFQSNHKIITGIAGSGKTHYTAHIIKTFNEKQDFVLFFKSKLFNGDNVNLEDRLLQLLEIPEGNTLIEVWENINKYCKKKNKRCLIIIDALNETTKSSIGFSSVWRNHLDILINQLKRFSHIYFVCTLRTSYINNVWTTLPIIAEIKGFENKGITNAACIKYFDYYKITINNIETADFSFFRNPLLLDLFCKLTNDSRIIEKNISLNVDSYLEIFEGYIENLITEVKNKLDYQSRVPISSGFSNSSSKFLDNNEAVLEIDDFSHSFDNNIHQSIDNSIARAVLDGYHVFIKDVTERKKEIVKHTQQEVGGYLLAKKISNEYPDTLQLVSSDLFKEKIIGNNTDLHHQLRLDILKFLIAMRPDIIKFSSQVDIITLGWWYLYNSDSTLNDPSVHEYLISLDVNSKIIEEIFNYSYYHWFSDKKFNFEFIASLLQTFPLWEYELKWTYFIYRNANEFYEIIDDLINELKGDNDNTFSKTHLKFVSLILSTTIRELRDKATIFFIEYGKIHPLDLLEICIESAKLKDIYVYERLTNCCYGIAMIKQNDENFITEVLPIYTRELFNFQFSLDTTESVYNYIVTDSIKHIIDLALIKKVIQFPEEDLKRIKDYKFTLPFDWIHPTRDQQELINNSGKMSRPDPINMDFGIYTIPRLIDRDVVNEDIAIANIYKRILELEYKELDLRETTNENFKSFFWGHTIYGIDGKSDRLGKKYCWVSFFDYAGYLLSNKQLDVFYKGDSAIESHYDRLSDVDVDISMPSKNYDVNVRLYKQNLFDKIDKNPNWYQEIKIDSIEHLFNTNFDDGEYSMLYGFVEQRLEKDNYDVRSFLLVESVLVDKSQIAEIEDLNRLRKSWDGDLHTTAGYLTNVYFGELYWADSIPILKRDYVYVPTLKKTQTITLSAEDIMLYDEFQNNNVGDIVEREVLGNRGIMSEPSLMEYLWESNSETLKGFGEYIPSPNIGKYLDLKVDPQTTQILDRDLIPAYKCIHHENNIEYFKNNFNYLRKDLLDKYLQENNLVILYQVKQHSYDKTLRHNRSMKFYIR